MALQHLPTPRELDDLELLTTGGYAPLTAFNEPGSPVTLTLPEDAGEQVELVDPEGLPLASVTVREGDPWPVEALTHAQYGPFRRLQLSPAQVREQYAGRTVVPVTGPLSARELAELRELGPLLLLALNGTGTGELSPVAMTRATLAAAALLPDAKVVTVPLPSHGDAEADHDLGVQVVRTYAGDDPVHALRAEAAEEDADLPDSIAAVVAEDRPAPEEQGLVVFFTGLSGSGKSTIARALLDRLLERGGRTVTSLDGDVVRRNLSAGLTFSRADRETNIRRIGWVAAEISRHGGVAVCSPIAPFDETRRQVRQMVDDAGGAFFLVHVATPVEECERRDRKGLYAKARRGEIPDFTGISSPYEEPEDADVRVDTTGRTIEECLDEVVDALAATGHLDLRTTAEAAPEEAADDDPLDVLFVCTANICRSPWLELRARQLLGADARVRFASAGTNGFTDHAMDEVMAATLDDAGQDAFRSRPLTGPAVEAADVVLTATGDHRDLVIAEFPSAFRRTFTLTQFVEAAEAEPAGDVRAVLQTLARSPRSPQDAPDIHDPYGKGPDAARTAAELMEEWVGRLVGILRR